MIKELTLGDLVRAADARGVDLHVRTYRKQPAAYRCLFCHSAMFVTAAMYDEGPFCILCLHERMTRVNSPLDRARMRCGLPCETLDKSSLERQP